MKVKSIKYKMILLTGLMLLLVSSGLGAISYYNSSKALISNVEKTFPKIAESSADYTRAKVEDTLHSVEAVAAYDTIADANKTIVEKLAVLGKEVQRVGYQKMGIVNLEGTAIYTDGNSTIVKDREYFKKAKEGTPNVSDPIISTVNNSVVVVYATPIKANGTVTGVLVATVDGNFLSQITNEINFGSTGKAFMLSKNGTTIAHSNKDLVLSMDNDFENVKKDPSLENLVELEKKMVAGEKGVGNYTYNKVNKYMGYAPVKGTGWSFAVVMNTDELLAELAHLRNNTIIFSGIFLLVGIIFMYFVAKAISKGIEVSANHIEHLSQGDFTVEVSDKYINSKDEIGHITRSVKTMQDSIREMIAAISGSSNSIDSQSSNLSALAEEMSASSENVATAIQGVAEGTGSQSGELAVINEVLEDFGREIENMVVDINKIDSNSRQINSMAHESGRDMEVLSESVSATTKTFKDFVSRISALSDEIQKINGITNVINNIADQTNLLALNAAIEAARVGEAGRGFAVVADEVRKLAEQSKESSVNINNLILNISNNTEVMIKTTDEMSSGLDNQNKVINNAISSFTSIISSVEEIIPQIDNVAVSADKINKEKNTIIEKVEEVSSISLEVSSTSEEIAASSEEMSASTEEVASSAQQLALMTNEMMEQINKFKI
jgi:methyl-accepting chemotaxis protein